MLSLFTFYTILCNFFVILNFEVLFWSMELLTLFLQTFTTDRWQFQSWCKFYFYNVLYLCSFLSVFSCKSLFTLFKPSLLKLILAVSLALQTTFSSFRISRSCRSHHVGGWRALWCGLLLLSHNLLLSLATLFLFCLLLSSSCLSGASMTL